MHLVKTDTQKPATVQHTLTGPLADLYRAFADSSVTVISIEETIRKGGTFNNGLPCIGVVTVEQMIRRDPALCQIFLNDIWFRCELIYDLGRFGEVSVRNWPRPALSVLWSVPWFRTEPPPAWPIALEECYRLDEPGGVFPDDLVLFDVGRWYGYKKYRRSTGFSFEPDPIVVRPLTNGFGRVLYQWDLPTIDRGARHDA